MGFLDKYTSEILGITRIISGLLFLAHGTAKIFNFPAREGWSGYDPMTMGGAAGAIELVAGTWRWPTGMPTRRRTSIRC